MDGVGQGRLLKLSWRQLIFYKTIHELLEYCRMRPAHPGLGDDGLGFGRHAPFSKEYIQLIYDRRARRRRAGPLPR